jgi:uncharacterized lipoprotein YajG
MKLLTAAAVILLLGGCATMQQPKQVAPKAAKAVKHVEPCPCSPTANQVVKKRWYDGFKVRWFH